MAAFQELEEFFVQLRVIRNAFDLAWRDRKPRESEVREAFAYFQHLGQSRVVGLHRITDPEVFAYAFHTFIAAPNDFGVSRKAYWPSLGIVAGWVIELSDKKPELLNEVVQAFQERFDAAKDGRERQAIVSAFENLCAVTDRPVTALWHVAGHLLAELAKRASQPEPSLVKAVQLLTRCLGMLALKTTRDSHQFDELTRFTLELLHRALGLIETLRNPQHGVLDDWVEATLALRVPELASHRTEAHSHEMAAIAAHLAEIAARNGQLATLVRNRVQPRVMHFLHGRMKRDNRPRLPERYTHSNCEFVCSDSGQAIPVEVDLEDVCHSSARGFRLYTTAVQVDRTQGSGGAALKRGTGNYACYAIDAAVEGQVRRIDAAKLTIAGTDLPPLPCDVLRAWKHPGELSGSGWIVYATDAVNEQAGWPKWEALVASHFNLPPSPPQSPVADVSTALVIAKGEGEHVEFKSTFRYNLETGVADDKNVEFSVLKAIAAFANGKGGTLLIGIADNGNVLGLARDYQSLDGQDKFQRTLQITVANHFKDKAFAAHDVSVHFASLDSKQVCRVDVGPSSEGRILVLADKSGKPTQKFYVRLGNQTVDMSFEEFAKYSKGRFRG